MGFFRRESLHERLAREGGLEERPVDPPRPAWDTAGIHGIHRPRQWDAVASAEVTGLEGDKAQFTVMPDGSLLLEPDEERDLAPLADAVTLEPPFRAEAVRQHETTWAVAARKIEVVELRDAPGDEIVLSSANGERTLIVDGAPGFGSVPDLERLAGSRHENYAAHAERLDGDLWQVSVSPL